MYNIYTYVQYILIYIYIQNMSVLPHSLSFILECSEYIPAFSHIEHLLMCLFTESKEVIHV